jgi:predicted dinucleotide-binding enzyme
MTTIGFIGSGNIDLIGELGPQARAATSDEAAAAGDIVVVTVPFKNYPQVPVEPLAGKVVIDTNNYYFERDGHFADIDSGQATVSGKLAEHLRGARVVKAFNSIRSAEIGDDAKPSGTPNRRALPIAGDDDGAKQVVRDLIDEFGFDVVDTGALVEGRRYDRDQPAYGAPLAADELRAALAAAS